MTDSRLRETQRAVAAGDSSAAAAEIVERMRAGVLSHDRVVAAAYLGDPAARTVVGEDCPCGVGPNDATGVCLGLPAGFGEWADGLVDLFGRRENCVYCGGAGATDEGEVWAPCSDCGGIGKRIPAVSREFVVRCCVAAVELALPVWEAHDKIRTHHGSFGVELSQDEWWERMKGVCCDVPRKALTAAKAWLLSPTTDATNGAAYILRPDFSLEPGGEYPEPREAPPMARPSEAWWRNMLVTIWWRGSFGVEPPLPVRKCLSSCAEVLSNHDEGFRTYREVRGVIDIRAAVRDSVVPWLIHGAA